VPPNPRPTQICAATYADLYLDTPPAARNASWLAATLRHYGAEIASPRSEVHWSWCDAIFMGVNVWARIGNITGDDKYFERMLNNFKYAVEPSGYGFWSEEDHLFYRDPPARGAPSGVYWSRGNGWVMGALVAALQYSPAEDPRRAVYVDYFKKHAARLRGLQGADGCWRVSLTQPEYNPVPETTGTALFTHGMAYGVAAGLLDGAEYAPALERAWRCLSKTALQPSGLVGYCQPVGWEPVRSVRPDMTSSFCTGQFMMAASSLSKLAPEAVPPEAGGPATRRAGSGGKRRG
jgi:unsaturated rhamnogalacturonyl hydrolase